MKQLEHHEVRHPNKEFPIVLVLDGVSDPRNIGHLFRTAEALGVTSVYCCGTPLNLKSRSFKATARATQAHLHHQLFEHTLSALDKLKADNYICIAIEITNTSQALWSFPFHSNQKYAFVLGNESTGVTAEVLAKCSHSLHIPMFGKNSSMNVGVAGAVALYEAVRQMERT